MGLARAPCNSADGGERPLDASNRVAISMLFHFVTYSIFHDLKPQKRHGELYVSYRIASIKLISELH